MTTREFIDKYFANADESLKVTIKGVLEQYAQDVMVPNMKACFQAGYDTYPHIIKYPEDEREGALWEEYDELCCDEL